MANSTHIQTRLDLILSQVLLKFDLVIQRDLHHSVSRDDAQAVIKRKQSRTNTTDGGTHDPATPPFLAAITLDHALAQPPEEEEGGGSIPRGHSCLPVSTPEPSAATITNTAGTTPCPHPSPAPGPHSLPVEPLLLDDNLPSSQAPHSQLGLVEPLSDNGILELEPTSCTPSITTPLPPLLPRKKNKKKRKNKMRIEADGRAAERTKRVASAEGGQGRSTIEYEQQQSQMGHGEGGGEAMMMMMGNLVRWGDTIPSTHASSMGHHHHHHHHPPPAPAFAPAHITGHGYRSYHASGGGPTTTSSYPNPAYYPYSLPDVPYPPHLGFYPNYSLPDPLPLLPSAAPHAASAPAPAPVDLPPFAAPPFDHPAF